MRPIPPKLRQELAGDEYYQICSRRDENCSGRITWEHAFTYAGRQINEKWAIIPLCENHHLGKLLNKKINHRIALARATKEDLKKYPKLKIYV
ncbi:MAG: hypothetical protein M1275_02540 [Patescibacteria group bacterium]|nr:hypothetical protein [Patescibacteria group bacterium]